MNRSFESFLGDLLYSNASEPVPPGEGSTIDELIRNMKHNARFIKSRGRTD